MTDLVTQAAGIAQVAPLLKGRVALVTGGSRGIGAATARLLALHGARVVVNYHSNQAAASQVVAAIFEAGGEAISLQADIGDAAQVAAMAALAEEKLGPIDTLILNATAIQRWVMGPFVGFGWDDFEQMMVGEIKAAFVPCQALVPDMIARRQGCIIAVSSGLSRAPSEGFCAHTTGKAGLDGFMKALALELAPHQIRVNVVGPGLILTDATQFMPQPQKDAMAAHTPMRRNGLPEDVAGAILMLAAPQSAFVTGAYLPVSGGLMML